jgi:hypothetical protein
MAEQMRPASKEQAPDPSHAYERSHPSREAGMGRLDNNKATPADQPDATHQAVGNKSQPDRQINAEDTDEPEQERLRGQESGQKSKVRGRKDGRPRS